MMKAICAQWREACYTLIGKIKPSIDPADRHVPVPIAFLTGETGFAGCFFHDPVHPANPVKTAAGPNRPDLSGQSLAAGVSRANRTWP
jgi:hypothetical protein